MENDFDMEALWKKQAVPAANPAEIRKRIGAFRRSSLWKVFFLNAVLVLTVAFLIFVWVYFQPRLLTTKIGILVGILPMGMVVLSHRKLVSLYRALDAKQPNMDYLDHLLRLKEREHFLQTRVMNLYFVLLPLGLMLYMYEYTLGMSGAFRVAAYVALLLWVAFNWFVLRPRIVGRRRRKMDALIGEVERIRENSCTFAGNS